uniref:Uncharacterized protein n=1 Tax=Lepeophtheirus salmonis TaxID=72036 RepID=A0A0K2UCE0_LEPSM
MYVKKGFGKTSSSADLLLPQEKVLLVGPGGGEERKEREGSISLERESERGRESCNF